MTISPPSLLAYLAISPASPEEAVLRLLINLGAQVVNADGGSLLVLDPEAQDLVFVMVAGESDKTLLGQRVPVGQGLTGLAALTQEVQVGSPTYVLASAQGELHAGQAQAVLAAPMLAGDTLVGVITAVRFKAATGRFSSQDAQLYGRLASVAGVVVHQRRRITALEALSRGKDSKQDDLGPAYRGIQSSVARLAQAHPDALDHVARLLLEIEALSYREGA